MSWDWDEGEWEGGGGGWSLSFSLSKRTIIIVLILLFLVGFTLYSIPGNPVFDYFHREDKMTVLSSLRVISADMTVYANALNTTIPKAIEEKRYADAKGLLSQIAFGMEYQTKKYLKRIMAIKGNDPAYQQLANAYKSARESVRLVAEGKLDPRKAAQVFLKVKQIADALMEKESGW